MLFACTHNAGRSQMAAALFNALSDPAQARAISAGTDPATEIHREVREAMAEIGIDLSRAEPQKLTVELAQEAQLLITMGCGDACPVIPALPTEDWPLPDPKGQPIERVREIRAQIETRVQELVLTQGWSARSR